MAGEDALVYFPMLSVPASGWMARQLLYWDQILVPTPIAIAERADEHFDHFTRALMDRGFVAYEFPENHFDLVHRVSNAFAHEIENTDLDVRRRTMDSELDFSIHEGKATHDLLDHLAHQGVARRATDGWWAVERITAHEYMASVSCAIAQAVGAGAITDSAVAASAVTGEPALALHRLLSEALPSPAEFDLELLSDLRQHREELHGFREATERYAYLVARAIDEDEAERWRSEYRSRTEQAESKLRKYLSMTARATRFVKGPYGSLITSPLGPIGGSLQFMAGLGGGPEQPHPDFAYSARVRVAIADHPPGS